MSNSQWNTLSSALLGTCWGLVGLVWLVGAVYNLRRAPAVWKRSSRGLLFAGVAIAWLIFRVLPRTDWTWASVHGWPVRAPGLALLLTSTVFTLWARLTLGTMWSSFVVVRDDHRLRTSGPYAITRHPIYTGLLGMLLGTMLANGLGRWTLVFAVAVVVVELKLNAEERLLTQTFRDEYERYRQRVPQLVPGLHLRTRPRHAGT